jgi:hypothetical protein
VCFSTLLNRDNVGLFYFRVEYLIVINSINLRKSTIMAYTISGGSPSGYGTEYVMTYSRAGEEITLSFGDLVEVQCQKYVTVESMAKDGIHTIKIPDSGNNIINVNMGTLVDIDTSKCPGLSENEEWKLRNSIERSSNPVHGVEEWAKKHGWTKSPSSVLVITNSGDEEYGKINIESNGAGVNEELARIMEIARHRR